MTDARTKAAAVFARLDALEQELALLKNATHEHTISNETILRLAGMIKADIAASLLPGMPQPASEDTSG